MIRNTKEEAEGLISLSAAATCLDDGGAKAILESLPNMGLTPAACRVVRQVLCWKEGPQDAGACLTMQGSHLVAF